MAQTSYRYQHLVRQDCPLPPKSHVVIYCRDSGGEEQDKSVRQQVEAAREYCERFDLTIDHIYKDEITATAVEKRDEFGAMMADLRQRFAITYDPAKRERRAKEKPFGVLCWKSNRLGRDVIHTRHVKSDLRLRGLTIVSLISSVETGNAGLDSVLESFFEYQDEQLLIEISDNARRGLAELVTLRDNDPDFLAHNPDWKPTGAYLSLMPGGVPTGFKGERLTVGTYKRKNGKRSGELRVVQRIVPDTDLWDRCRLAWQMRHDGATINDIMATTRLFKSVSSYAAFFSNLIYTGTLDYGGQRLENFVPALIPLEWWEQEQQRKEQRGKKLRGGDVPSHLEPRRVGGQHLLSGLLFCGDVEGEEHPMQADMIPAKKNVRGHWDFYICGIKKNSRGNQCVAKRIGARAIEKAVVDSLMMHVLTREALYPLADIINTEAEQSAQYAETTLATALQELERVQRQIDNLVNAIEETGMSASLKDKLSKREAERDELSATVNYQRRLLMQVQSGSGVTQAMLDKWIGEMRERLLGSDIDRARQALRHFVDKIVMKGTAGDIFYSFPWMDAVERLGERDMDPRGSASLPSQRCPLRLPFKEDLYPDKVALAQQVLIFRRMGMSYREIGKALNIHWTRVPQILKTIR